MKTTHPIIVVEISTAISKSLPYQYRVNIRITVNTGYPFTFQLAMTSGVSHQLLVRLEVHSVQTEAAGISFALVPVYCIHFLVLFQSDGCLEGAQSSNVTE